MNKKNQKWDLRQRKKGHSALIADNVVIAWPVMLQLIEDNHVGNIKVLDYSCGTGGFCRRMRSEGLRVEGIDSSRGTIRAASRQSSDKIRYYVGDKKFLQTMTGTYDAITSIMGFQFMEDLETYLPLFSDLLNDRGIVVFAVFNPDFVESCRRGNMIFRSFRTIRGTTVASMEIKKGVMVDAYVRSKDQYKELFRKHGFEFLSSRYPPFTPDFITRYKWKLPSEDSEYLVMAVRK